MAIETRSHKSAKSHALYDLLGSGSEITHSVEVLEFRAMCDSVLKEVKRIWDNVNPEICIIG